MIEPERNNERESFIGTPSHRMICFLLYGGGELFQETDVVFEEQPQVLDAVFQHGDTFDAHTQGKAGVCFLVNTV